MKQTIQQTAGWIITTVLLLYMQNLSAQCTKCPSSTSSPAGASAIGTSNTASGVNSFAGGTQSVAFGNQSMAFGNVCSTGGSGSIALGQAANAQGALSVSIGHTVSTIATESYGFGQYLETSSSNCMVIGRGNGPTKVLRNNISNSLMIGFNSTLPTLFVGPSATYNSYGKVGINNTNPLQPLHVNGNILLTGFNSTLLFADDPPTNGSWGKWGIEYDASDPLNTGLNFWKPASLGKSPTQTPPTKSALTGNYVLFLKDNGNIGIGTSAPLAKLHVEGTANVTQAFTVGSSQQAASINVFGPTILTGSLKVTTLQSGNASMIVADKDGNLGVAPIPTGGDQMGSHIATQNLQMNGKFITNDERTNTSEGIFIGPTGNVGIKTSTIADIDDFTVFAPSTKAAYLRVQSQSTNASIVWTTGGSKTIGMGVIGDKGYIFETNKDTKVITIKDGRVGIGVSDSDVGKMSGAHKLFVAGGITAEEVKVKLIGNWPDYVFNNDYQLSPLTDLDQYIKINQHLPEIPCQTEVEKDGINLGTMDALLLKKIEELTLYIIEQDKRIRELESKE